MTDSQAYHTKIDSQTLRIGHRLGQAVDEALGTLDGKGKAGRVAELWDGRAASRIVKVLEL